MGSLSQPKSPLTTNPGAATETKESVLAGLGSRTLVQQIHGINVSGSTGAGIPKQVTGLQANISNASTGTTTKVTILFNRDSSDTALAGVKIWVKGYQSNSSLVQVAQGVDSPITFVLTNTGEAVTFVAQAFGNGGSAPIASSPSVGLSLPKSSLGGVGTSTKTTTTSTTLTGDVTTSGSAATVVGLQNNPIPSGTPADGDFLYYSSGDSSYERDFAYDWLILIPGAAQLPSFNLALGPWVPVSGSFTGNNNAGFTLSNSTSRPSGINCVTTTSGTGKCGWALSGLSTAPFNAIKRVRTVLKLNQTTNTRLWIVVGDGNDPINYTGTDNPNSNLIGFRYSSTTDTNFMAYCATSSVNFTATSTGIPADTNLHTFDFVYLGSKVLFYIDNNLVATITTNIPASTVTANPAMTLDNKAAGALAQSLVFWSMRGSMPRTFR